MREYNAEFEAYRKSTSLEPRFTIRIDFASDFSDPVYILSHSDAAYPGGATVIASRIVSGSTISQTIAAISSIGSITLQALDNGSAFTALLYSKLTSSKGIRLKRVRVYKGFKGMAWANYEIVATQTIGELSYKNGVYSLKCNDIQRLVKDTKIFTPVYTTLKTTVSETESTKIYVYNTAPFIKVAHGTSYTDAPSAEVFYVKIEDEIIRCSGVGSDGGGDYLTIHTSGRGALNTKAVAHTVEASQTAERRQKVEEYIYIEMPVVKLIYAILLGALYGQSGKTLPAHWCLTVDTEYVENDDFTTTTIKDLYDTSDDTKGVIARFEGLTAISAKDFIENELLTLIGCFMPVYANGGLGLKRRTPVVGAAGSTVSIDTSNTVSHGELVYDFSKLANQYRVYWNYSGVRKDFLRTTSCVYTDSITKHTATDKKEIKLRGLHGSRHTDSTIGNVIDLWAERNVYPQWMLDVSCNPRVDNVENGDIVTVTLPTLKDFTGNGTLSRSFEVIGTTVDFVTGKTDLKLQCSSEKIKAYADFSSSAVLADAWYTSQGGNNINTLSGYIAGPPARLSTDVTAAGNAVLTSGVWYHNGDLTIDATKVLTITQNVMLIVKGVLTINGTISGKGQGITGLTAPATSPINAAPQNPDNYGRNMSGSGFSDVEHIGAGLTVGVYKENLRGYAGRPTASININVEYDGTNLKGLLTDLRGAPGAGGSPLIHDATTTLGGNGGNGGAGLMIVARGVTFGASGKIDLSGNDGLTGATYDFTENGKTSKWYAGGGAPGMPGVLIVCLDGNTATIPEEDKFYLLSGASHQNIHNEKITSGVVIPSNGYRGFSSVYFTNGVRMSVTNPSPNSADLKAVNSRILFIKDSRTVQNDPIDTKPTAPTSLNIVHNENALITLQDGSQIVGAILTWTASTDRNVDGYYVYYKKTSDTYFQRFGTHLISRSDATCHVYPLVQGTNYTFRVVAKNIWGNESDYISTSATITGKSNNPSVPTSVTLTSVTGGLRIDGTAPSDTDIAGVEIERSANGSTGWTLIKTTGVTRSAKFSYTDTFTAPTTYYYRVRSVDTSNLKSSYVNTSPTSATSVNALSSADNIASTGQLLPNWNFLLEDSSGYPAGIRGIEGTTVRTPLSYGDSTKTFIQISNASDLTSGFGFPAIPIDDKQKYRVTIRHKSNQASAAGLYLRFFETTVYLSNGKTHVGVSATGESVCENYVYTNNMVANGPMPGTSWVESTYTYTPTSGTKFASFCMYNWNATAGTNYHVAFVQMDLIAKDADQVAESATKKWKGSSFRIVSAGNSATNAPFGASGSRIIDENGNTVYSGGRSYNVAVWNRSANTWDSHTTYDVFGSSANATTMANALNALDTTKIVVIYTSDEPQNNKTTSGFADAIYRCGGSPSIFGSPNFQYRGGYILIGIPGIGAGNGMEYYQGAISSDPNGWVETSIDLKNAVGFSGMQTEVTKNALDNGILTTGYLAVKNSTFGNAGVQLRYNSGNDVGELYVGDGGEKFLKVEHNGTSYEVSTGRDTQFRGASSYYQDAIYFHDYLNKVSGWHVSGSYQEPGGYILLDSLSSSEAKLTKYINSSYSLLGASFAKSSRFKTKIVTTGGQLSTTTIRVFVGYWDSTYDGYGFEIISSTLYGFSTKSGGGGTKVSNSTGVTISNGTAYKLEAIKTASDVKFYVDDVLKTSATITTTSAIPVSGAFTRIIEFSNKNTSGSTQSLGFSEIKFLQEA